MTRSLDTDIPVCYRVCSMPAGSHSADSSIARVFETQAELQATKAAICTADQSWSYAQVEASANKIANKLLQERGRGNEAIPLLVSDPALMLISLLGVLKAGKFYVPINPNFPATRIGMILEDVLPELLISDKAGQDAIRSMNPSCGSLLVEEVLAGPTPDARPAIAADPSRFAYVLYTSGSTGRPKGVAQSERNVLHNVLRHQPLHVSPEDHVTLISADGFVGAVSNPYVALLNGACLYPYSFRSQGVHGMLEWLEQNRITFYYSFPSFFRQFIATLARPPQVPDLRLVYLGGEPVFSSDVASVRKIFPGVTVAIGLNSTETGLTTLNLIAPEQEGPKQTVPVGRPVMDIEALILDEDGQPLPPETAGEIAISSPYVAPWHWKKGKGEDGTVPASAGDARIFKTGDRGLLNQRGELVHMGRVDSMVKIRGYRVELTEVESALSSVPAVAEAAVAPYQRTPEETELAAYVVVSDRRVDANALRQVLGEKLPDSMLPSAFVFMDTLPRTENGKVNRRMLPAPAMTRASSASQYVEPANPVEEQVARIWSKVLSVMKVGVKDNFFNLGGHSLTAVRVVSMIRKEFGVPLPLKVIFDTPTVAAVAKEIARLKGPPGPMSLESAVDKGHSRAGANCTHDNQQR